MIILKFIDMKKKNYFVTDYNKIISKKTKKLYLLREMNNYF